MEEKKSIKIRLSTFFLMLAIIVIVIMAYFLYKLNNEKIAETEKVSALNSQVSNFENKVESLQGTIDNVSNIVNDTKNENVKTEIPKASTNISEDEKKVINYFQGVWTADNGEKLLAIDYGKRFCDINKSNNSKEYGTYTVKDETSSSVPTITLTYTSGKILELELTQGSANYLMTNDRKVQYVEYEGYYFGAGEGDEGIFDDDKSIPSASTNISDKEKKIISNYFKGVWITSNGKNLLVVDYGKRFCDINSSNNSKEYGTYTVKDGTEPTIILTYTSGKTLTLKLTQGGTSYLMSNDGKVQYVNCDAYYFGASEGDEGIFNN